MVQALLLGAGDVTIVMAGKTTLAHPNTMIGHVHAVRLAAIDLAVTMFTVDAGVLARQAVVGLFASGMMVVPGSVGGGGGDAPQSNREAHGGIEKFTGIHGVYLWFFDVSSAVNRPVTVG